MATGRFRDYQALNLLSIVHLNGPAFVAGNVNAIRFGPNQSGLSAPIIAVPNGAFTMLVVGRRTSGGDFMNITDGTTNWWHGDALVSTADLLTDDDGVAGSNSTVITTPASTDLWAAISSCPASGTAETFYFRNITQNTGGGALTGAANGGKRAMTGSNFYITLGQFQDNGGWTGDLVVAAIWGGKQLSAAQAAECWANNKTSDIWNNSAGHPDFLIEGNTLSLVDLAGGNTFVSAGSATLTGADPAWTFDGIGSAPSAPPAIWTPHRMPLGA
jgi:hypothetical protein